MPATKKQNGSPAPQPTFGSNGANLLADKKISTLPISYAGLKPVNPECYRITFNGRSGLARLDSFGNIVLKANGDPDFVEDRGSAAQESDTGSLNTSVVSSSNKFGYFLRDENGIKTKWIPPVN